MWVTQGFIYLEHYQIFDSINKNLIARFPYSKCKSLPSLYILAI